MAAFKFDPSTVEKRENNFELIPAGNYLAQITETEIKALTSGNGDGLKLTFEILSEGHRGRKIWVNLNIRHSNAQAEQISQQQLRELCEAAGIARLDDTDQLKGIPVDVKVKIRKSTNPAYEDQNEIVGYKSASSQAQPGFRAQPGAAANTPAVTPSGGKPPAPWETKRAA